jgi:hypothetical protein
LEKLRWDNVFNSILHGNIVPILLKILNFIILWDHMLAVSECLLASSQCSC